MSGHPSFEKEAKVAPHTVRACFDYDPETGILTRKQRRSNRLVGEVVGCLQTNGYLRASICDRLFLVHRIVWCHFYEQWPTDFIDHINMNKSDNRITNLRVCSKSFNNANTGKSRANKSGFKGVIQKGPNLWIAEIQSFNKKRTLGRFSSPIEAQEAYLKAAQDAFGEFARSE